MNVAHSNLNQFDSLSPQICHRNVLNKSELLEFRILCFMCDNILITLLENFRLTFQVLYVKKSIIVSRLLIAIANYD